MGRARPNIVRPEPTAPYVSLPLVKGGEFADNACHDTAIMEPFDGQRENVMMRVFAVDGTPVEVRFHADAMREALDSVEALRRAG